VIDVTQPKTNSNGTVQLKAGDAWWITLLLLYVCAVGQAELCVEFSISAFCISFILGRARDLYLCLYNQLFALFHYVFKFLTP